MGDYGLRNKRFGVRLMAAFDLLFPRTFAAFGRLLMRLPKWLTGVTEKEKDMVRRQLDKEAPDAE